MPSGSPVSFESNSRVSKPSFVLKAERSIIVSRLHEPHAGDTAPRAACKYIEHQLTVDRLVLRGGIDSNRSDAGDRTAFVEKIAAKHLAIAFGDDRVKQWMSQSRRHQRRRGLRRREGPRKVVFG